MDHSALIPFASFTMFANSEKELGLLTKKVGYTYYILSRTNKKEKVSLISFLSIKLTPKSNFPCHFSLHCLFMMQDIVNIQFYFVSQNCTTTTFVGVVHAFDLCNYNIINYLLFNVCISPASPTKQQYLLIPQMLWLYGVGVWERRRGGPASSYQLKRAQRGLYRVDKQSGYGASGGCSPRGKCACIPALEAAPLSARTLPSKHNTYIYSYMINLLKLYSSSINFFMYMSISIVAS